MRPAWRLRLGRKGMLRVGVAVLLFGLLSVLAVDTVRRTRGILAAGAVCEAAAAGDLEEARRLWPRTEGTGGPAQRAAVCVCTAHLRSGDTEGCAATLEAALADPASKGWLPGPSLVAIVAGERLRDGNLVGAAALARQASIRYREHEALLRFELAVRSLVEDRADVLTDMEERLSVVARGSPEWRIRFSEERMKLGHASRTLDLLGEIPPSESAALRDRWFALRSHALADLGRVADLRRTMREWERTGAGEATVLANYALRLSLGQLTDPERDLTDLMREVVARRDEITDRRLVRSIYYRLVRRLTVNGRHEEALALWDEAAAQFDDWPTEASREEILRSASQAALGEERLMRATGVLRFAVRDPEPGDVLRISPDPTVPKDSRYESFPLRPGEPLRVERSLGTFPQRWVLENASGDTVASGTVWPMPQGLAEIEIERGPAVSEPVPRTGTTPSPDGHRRVFVVVLDCADWRLVQYGRERGDLPNLGRMLDEGFRAVLESAPPYTAIAMRSIVQPRLQGIDSFVGLVHHLGTEIEALNFVGENPFDELEWLVPGTATIFDELGARELTVVNLLHSFGSLDLGRQGEMIGPHGEVRMLDGLEARRPLASDESRLVTDDELGAEEDRYLREMAADFDNLETVVQNRSIDFAVLRVASLDLLTHKNFALVNRTRQDDGAGTLYGAYRYIDRRLGETWSELDGDDVLVVMSDHGIRTALEHDPDAFFVAVGERVPHGRAPGRPGIRGIGRMVADVLGVEVDWPATGIEAWVAARDSG